MIPLFAILPAIRQYWKLAAIIGYSALVGWFAWHWRGVRCEAAEAERLAAALAAHTAAESESYRLGRHLEDSFSAYQPAARDIDKEVQDATTHDTGNRFTADGVRRAATRIAAGESARQRRE